MSAKHSIVPRGLTEAEALRISSLPEREKELQLARFERVTARQARALRQAGLIVQLGANGKIWQRVDVSFARPSEETGNGRVSLEVPRSIKELLTAEMGGRPGWGLEEAYG